MPSQVRKRVYSLAIVLLLLVAGVFLLASPVVAEETRQAYSRPNFSADEVNVDMGYAPPRYFASAQISSGNTVTVIITVLLGTTSTEVFRASFPAGSFEISRVSMGSGGTVFLSVESQGGSLTQMSVFARVFHYVTTYPYSWAGLVVVCVAGLFALATEFPRTGFGKIARMILPVEKLGL